MKGSNLPRVLLFCNNLNFAGYIVAATVVSSSLETMYAMDAGGIKGGRRGSFARAWLELVVAAESSPSNCNLCCWPVSFSWVSRSTM